MSNKKQQAAKPEPKKDLHKPRRMIGVPTRVADLLEQYAKANYRNMAVEATAAIIEYLKSKGVTVPPHTD